MQNLQKAAQENLKRLIDQIERLEAERAALSADIRDKFEEAKNTGFDTKILRRVLQIRKKDKAEHEEEEAILATYLHALGWAGTPMGDFADQVIEDVKTIVTDIKTKKKVKRAA